MALAGNLPLVERAVRIAKTLDRPIATVGETEQILKLGPLDAT